MPFFLRPSLIIGMGMGAALLAGCNNPEADSKKLFTDMGLTLLQPERSYVAPGGLVVLPENGRPVYIDPLDNPNPTGNSEDKRNEVDFQAVFAKVAKSDHVGLQLAVQLVSSVLPSSGGLQVGSDTQVTLDQINASGTRMLYGALKSFVTSGATAAELKAQLAPGNKARAFIVQEIYKSTSMSLKSTTNTSLSVSLTTGQPVPACASQFSSSSSGASSSTSSSGGASGSSGSGGITAASSSSGAGQPAVRVGGSLSLCLGPNNYSLSFTSNDPVQFAVRLMEVQLQGGGLSILQSGKPLPGSMGAGIGEASATIGDGSAQSLLKVCPKTLTSQQCNARLHHRYN